MPPKPVPIITDGVHGQPPINWYPAKDSEKGVILQPTPGLLDHCYLTGCTELRGCDTFLGYMYFVARRGSDSVVWRVDGTGDFVEVGNFSTSFTGPVSIEHSTDQLAVCDGVTIYVYTPATGAFGEVTDPNFPGTATTITSQDGYLLFSFSENSREWGISKLFDFTQYDAAQFYVKEGKPDNVVVVKSLLREPWIGGQQSIEVWGNVGGSGVNPTFMRNSGGLLEYGVGARSSMDVVNSKMMWLSDKGQWLQAIAYQPSVKSTQMMERAVGQYAAFDDAISFSYTQDNHIFNVLTFPTGGETWVWDDTTQVIHKRQSYLTNGTGQGRWRANCYTLYNNRHFVGDYENGYIYEMKNDCYTDHSVEIRREFYLQEMDTGGTLVKYPDIELGVKSGVGLESGLDPQVILQFSSDQGESWSNEVTRSAGKIGEAYKKVTWTDMGEGYWRQYRVVVTDPVFWQIQSVSQGD